MATRLSNVFLLEVAKYDSKTINGFRRGAHITRTTGKQVDDLIVDAARDRFLLAGSMLGSARWASKPPKPQFRVTLARSYYAMYHAARAVVYLTKPGDDHEAHSELPKYFPSDFPDRARWENSLKVARLERNKADYDPYPKSDRSFALVAKATLQEAVLFLPLARQYLRKNGCKL